VPYELLRDSPAYVEVRLSGVVSLKEVQAYAEQLTEIGDELVHEGRHLYILFDYTVFGRFGPHVEQLAAKILGTLKFDRLARIGISQEQLAQVRERMYKGGQQFAKTQSFATREEAVHWLETGTLLDSTAKSG
jgi:hypothetical protein